MKQNDLFFVVISSFIVGVFWMGFSIYHAHVSSTLTDTQTVQVVPIKPHFDTKVIDQLKTRSQRDPLFEAPQPQASSSPTPTTPSLSPTPVGSPSATSGI